MGARAGQVGAPELDDGGVQLWRIDLDDPAANCEQLLRLLDHGEARRAGALLRPVDRRRFIVAHAALRQILGPYCGRAAARVRLHLPAEGRPRLACVGPRFSLSHSGSRALVAVSRRVVGADLEQIRDDFDLVSFAVRFFQPAEAADLIRAPKPRRPELFFRYWTVKEAYLKALGTGLAALPAAGVGLGPDGPWIVGPMGRQTGGRGATASGWTAAEFRPALGYVAAVVVPGPRPPISFRTWTPPTQFGAAAGGARAGQQGSPQTVRRRPRA